MNLGTVWAHGLGSFDFERKASKCYHSDTCPVRNLRDTAKNKIVIIKFSNGMISRKDIHNLAQLARIEMSKEEETSLTKDVENILDFVDQIQSVKTVAKKSEGDIGVVKNTMRGDGEPHRSGKYTEELLDEAPHKHNGFIKVKKII